MSDHDFWKQIKQHADDQERFDDGQVPLSPLEMMGFYEGPDLPPILQPQAD